jgi:thioesterase domain-containing protein
MDEMITDYLAAIRQYLPTGPYYLAGWSAGGIFAFALAEAMERAGDEIGMLALIDTPMPSICDELDVGDDARFLCDLVNFASRFSGHDIRVSYDELASLEKDEQFLTALAEARRCGMIPAETPEEYVRRLVRVGEANVLVIQSYQPRPLSAPVQFFVPTDRSALKELAGREPPDDSDLGWSREIGQNVALHVVPGDHFTMMQSVSASILGRQLSQCLEEAAAAIEARIHEEQSTPT